MVKFKSPEYFSDSQNFCLDYYLEKFKIIPCLMTKSIILKEKEFSILFNEFFDDIKEVASQATWSVVNKHVYITNIYYELEEDVVVYINYGYLNKLKVINTINFYYPQNKFEKIKEFFEKAHKETKLRTPKENHINIIVQNGDNLSLREFKIKKPKFNIQDNYNDDLLEINNNLLKRLNAKDDKGIALFYSTPGAGKTSYIKFLMSKLRKTVIYMPPDMSHLISAPSFIPFLMNYKNSILIIEDSENVIKSRESGQNQSIANLLNLSDGLLSDILNIQIIATFNCKIDDIDSALLRKGRLITKYEFLPLKKEKAQALSNKLGKNTIIENDTPLCEIYNQDEISYSQSTRRSVGFRKPKYDTDLVIDLPAIPSTQQTYEN